MARTVGIEHPGRVRVVVLEEFPLPANEILRIEATKYGFGSTTEGGRTMGYVIMLKEKHQEKKGDRFIFCGHTRAESQ
jgi:hypothetical protein